ncbi:26S proteasome non-ATPase regulatory subunit 13-like [Saccoglossus kowalevskii]|uniref:26S proteasome non-ATPase regulatory subunit 13 n=1 Tax=Saccoglossus kowalevskii TaxID=10224 RepID=A0ABM0GPL8_SACKO|nr:PREDICTED: 26S proteasome non-ATPase regulatory subunit 13-like [Saccoglossus kowalevskii]
MKDVSGFLSEQQSSSSPEVAAEWAKLEELYNKKLWHQLTLHLLVFVKNPCFDQGDGLLQLYEHFLSDFEHRINALSLTELVVIIIKQIKDPDESVAFLEKIKEKVKANEEAVILCMTAMAIIKLRTGKLEECKVIVLEAGKLLENIDGVTTVHSRYYDVTSNCHKLMGSHADYYREALRYLGCINVEDIPSDEQKDRAFNLGLAALLGDGVYNFGELLAHPVLDSLKETDKIWLVDLLFAFNSGNLERYESLKPQWKQQPDLAASEMNLRQKISLLCLMEMTFTRPANHRNLAFDEIAKEARLPVGEVEHLVMKALSLGLVKGSIDEVDKKVHMTWVQPRVLDLQQIAGMQQRLQHWCTDVQNMEMMVEVKAQDILT